MDGRLVEVKFFELVNVENLVVLFVMAKFVSCFVYRKNYVPSINKRLRYLGSNASNH